MYFASIRKTKYLFLSVCEFYSVENASQKTFYESVKFKGHFNSPQPGTQYHRYGGQ